jgi:hypothetical protein
LPRRSRCCLLKLFIVSPRIHRVLSVFHETEKRACGRVKDRPRRCSAPRSNPQATVCRVFNRSFLGQKPKPTAVGAVAVFSFMEKEENNTRQTSGPRLAVAVGCPAACAAFRGTRTPAGLPTTRFRVTIAQARINTPYSSETRRRRRCRRRNARVGLVRTRPRMKSSFANRQCPGLPSRERFAPGADRAAASCRRRQSACSRHAPHPRKTFKKNKLW